MSRPPLIPFIDLARFTHLIAADVERDLRDCLARQEFVGGPRVAMLEAALSRTLGVAHAVTCGSGSQALTIALRVLGVQAGDRVALPDLTFWASYEAIAALGAVPVLLDIDADDLQLSVDELARAHAALNLKACVCVHLFGFASRRLPELRRFCREQGLALLEDGAQAFGVEYQGQSVFAGAEAATLSFYPAKVVGGAMDGGAMFFRSSEHAARARRLCNHGRTQHYAYAEVGYNSRMSGFQAAYLLRVLERLPEILADRRRSAHHYRELLADVAQVRAFRAPEMVQENGYLNVLTCEGWSGSELADGLKERGVSSGRIYPAGLSEQPPARDALRFGDLPVTRAFCARVLNLPLFFGITRQEREFCAGALERLLAEKAR